MADEYRNQNRQSEEEKAKNNSGVPKNPGKVDLSKASGTELLSHYYKVLLYAAATTDDGTFIIGDFFMNLKNCSKNGEVKTEGSNITDISIVFNGLNSSDKMDILHPSIFIDQVSNNLNSIDIINNNTSNTNNDTRQSKIVSSSQFVSFTITGTSGGSISINGFNQYQGSAGNSYLMSREGNRAINRSSETINRGLSIGEFYSIWKRALNLPNNRSIPNGSKVGYAD